MLKYAEFAKIQQEQSQTHSRRCHCYHHHHHTVTIATVTQTTGTNENRECEIHSLIYQCMLARCVRRLLQLHVHRFPKLLLLLLRRWRPSHSLANVNESANGHKIKFMNSPMIEINHFSMLSAVCNRTVR